MGYFFVPLLWACLLFLFNSPPPSPSGKPALSLVNAPAMGLCQPTINAPAVGFSLMPLFCCLLAATFLVNSHSC